MKYNENGLKTHIIVIKGNEYSMRGGEHTIRSITKNNLASYLDFSLFKAVTPDKLTEYDIKKYTYPTEGVSYKHQPTGLDLNGYTGNIEPRIACLKSHMTLWKEAVDINEPILILEHDAVFSRNFKPENVVRQLRDGDILMLNDPRGATRRGRVYHERIIENDFGIHPIDGVNEPNENSPDGIAGNSAYIITPKAAKKALEYVDKFGYWPNDAVLCKQLFPKKLKSIYPYITTVNQKYSTTSMK